MQGRQLALRVAAARELEELDVSNNILRATGLAQAADALASAPRLRVLNLGTNSLGGEAGAAIARVLRGAKSLEVRRVLVENYGALIACSLHVTLGWVVLWPGFGLVQQQDRGRSGGAGG